MRCRKATWNRVAVATIAIMALGTTGCKSGMSGSNIFAWGRKPSAETLAGSGPSTTYPAPPSEKHTPTTVASAAIGSTGGSTAAPNGVQVASNSSPYGAPSNAAQANGFNPGTATSPYGATSTPNPYGQPSASPYGAPSSSPYGAPTTSPYGAPSGQPAFSTASAATSPAYAAPPATASPYAMPSSSGPTVATQTPYSSAPQPNTGGYRPGSTSDATAYPGMNNAVAPSTYTQPSSPSPSFPSATSPTSNGSFFR